MQKETEYLFSLEKFGTRLGLERVAKLCELLNNPENSFNSIHVAGTNGKGSVCAFVYSILREAGFRVGLYTSPHLVDFRERIEVNGKKITEKELIEEIKKIKKLVEKEQNEEKEKTTKKQKIDEKKETEKNNKIDSDFQPTFFEFSTALAFDFFRKKKVQFAVIETGMGGRLDATNVLAKPKIEVITNIALEHTEHLGKTVEEIAFEKAGIIKNNSAVITGEENEKALEVIRKKCEEKKAELFEAKNLCSWKRKNFDLQKQEFDAEIEGKKYKNLEISLLGEHQLKNACLALLAVQELKEKKIREKEIRNGLKKAFWAGRLQIVQKKPLVVFDAAHNPACMKVLGNSLQEIKEIAKKERIALVLGISSNKDIKEMVEIIAPLARKIIVTQAKERGAEPNIIVEEIRKLQNRKETEKKQEVGKRNEKEIEIEVIPSVSEAARYAMKAAKENELLCITGSIFVLGEAFQAIGKNF